MEAGGTGRIPGKASRKMPQKSHRERESSLHQVLFKSKIQKKVTAREWAPSGPELKDDVSHYLGASKSRKV